MTHWSSQRLVGVGCEGKNTPTSHRDSLVVVEMCGLVVRAKNTPTSHRDSLVVAEAGGGRLYVVPSKKNKRLEL